MNKKYAIKYYPCPVGTLHLMANEQYLIGVVWQQEHIRQLRQFTWHEVASHPILDYTILQLEQYFARQRQTFDIPTFAHGTSFQQDVWNALKTIPYGETRSYRDIAEYIGRPKAARAVGSANGQNPLSIIVPCHRVIGKNGALVGFGGGLNHKQSLLMLEQSDGLI